jgi:hypothetical protein
MFDPAELASVLSSVLVRRSNGNQPTIINLMGDATVFRPYSPAFSAGPHLSLDALLSHEASWAPVGRFSRFLEPALGASAVVRGCDGWGGALMPYLALSACDWAAILARQMGAELTCSVAPGCIDSAFRQDFAACLGDASRAMRVTNQTVEALAQVVKSPPSWRLGAHAPAMLRFEPNGETTRVIWLARDGKELGRETLGKLATRMSSEKQVTDLLAEAKGLQSRLADHREGGDRKLQAACPAMAEAVKRAREHGRHVGYRMFLKDDRGLPADVYVFVGPGPDAHRYVCANLVARRAHEEFVLENRAGQLFYFPPVQLQAMVEFIPSQPHWHLPMAMVRMPACQPRWMHPYTGSLHTDRFADAELFPNGSVGVSPGARADLPDDSRRGARAWDRQSIDRGAMVAISDDARRLLPALSQCPGVGPSTGCMCLGGQDYQIAQATQLLREAEAAGSEPNLLGAVRALWNTIRVGLTRGHQNNGNTPIAELGTTQMPYLVRSASDLHGTRLAARFFPYQRTA